MAQGRHPFIVDCQYTCNWQKPHLAEEEYIMIYSDHPQASRIMSQSCSHKSHPHSLCVFPDRPAPIPFYTVTFSHQRFGVYWAFPSREGSSSMWWKSISHFHRASSLSDSASFPCFILHLISSQQRHVVLGRELWRLLSCTILLCGRGQWGRTQLLSFPFENYNYILKKIRPTDLHCYSFREPREKGKERHSS